jgi:DNA-binding protein H-NS
MQTYSQIQSQIEKLQKEAESARKREIAETIASIKRAIQVLGLTAQDLGLDRLLKASLKSPTKTGGKKRGRPSRSGLLADPRKKSGRKSLANKTAKKPGKTDKRSIVAPKYRNASTGDTWTGRGKQPKWLAAALKSGKKLEDFKI